MTDKKRWTVTISHAPSSPNVTAVRFYDNGKQLGLPLYMVAEQAASLAAQLAGAEEAP